MKIEIQYRYPKAAFEKTLCGHTSGPNEDINIFINKQKIKGPDFAETFIHEIVHVLLNNCYDIIDAKKGIQLTEDEKELLAEQSG